MKTFYWYDFETFGVNPKTARIAQFAGIRTDENLRILDEQMFYCKPTQDCLPSPQACAITGISPQLCEEKGLIEHKFMQKIHVNLSQPETCTVGYNSIRFDDEFTRYALYRNFIDPYAWHWKNGNTRWDILDVVRLCYALKKDSCLKWVYDENNKPIFKLDQLAPANGLDHGKAHDALEDVRVTIAIAKIIKQTQPNLFAYAFSLREKKTVEAKIQLFEPMLHTSGMYPAELSCTRLCVALSYHPEYKDRVIVFNLDQDPAILLELEPDELKALIFTKQSELPKGKERLQIKELIFNKSPMFVENIYKLDPVIVKQLQLDMSLGLQRIDFIKKNQLEISKIMHAIYRNDQMHKTNPDVDQRLYDGFISDADRRISNKIQTLESSTLKNFHPKFQDEKLSVLLMHFKARNYPKSLTKSEQKDWFNIIQNRLQSNDNDYLSLDNYHKFIDAMRKIHLDKEKLWQQLEKYAESLKSTCRS